MKIGGIIACAGAGKRMKSRLPKQFMELEGKPVILWTVERFLETGFFREVVVVVPPRYRELSEDILKGFKRELMIVEGGKLRQESVFKGLCSLSNDIDIVLIHDGVRPFFTKALFKKVIKVTKEKSACVPCLPLKETLKEVQNNEVKRTVDRTKFYLSQTPQGFAKELIYQAHLLARRQGYIGTDDAELLERMGKKVAVVDGEEWNIKLTTRADFELGRSIIKSGGIKK